MKAEPHCGSAFFLLAIPLVIFFVWNSIFSPIPLMLRKMITFAKKWGAMVVI